MTKVSKTADVVLWSAWLAFVVVGACLGFCG